ncbi:hypothetical protein MYX84_04050 [Acidobacteria bacterium AH-259-O06]|nr:hypothetical protein [Acidobacteria bacterium AH-259-O06]
MIRKTWVGKPDGIRFQALRVIARLSEVKVDEMASLLLVPTRYAEELCQKLVKDGYITKSARGGYTLKENLSEEILEFVKLRQVIYRDEVCKQFMISPEEATRLCEALVEAGHLIKTSRGGYLLKKDKDLALTTIQRLNKETTKEEVGERLGVPASYAGLLCDLLAREYAILRTPKGTYRPAEKDQSRVLRIVREHGQAPIGGIVHKMKITPAYAELLCSNLVKQDYLKKVPKEAYALVEKKR